MTQYLHGVETLPKGTVPKNVSEAKTSIIGIVGTANPAGLVRANYKVNEPVVILKESDVALIAGVDSEKYSLPKYLNKVYAQFTDKVPVIIMINVNTLTDVEEAEKTAVENVIDLGHADICGVVVKNAAGTTTYEEGTDYSVDYAAGKITMLNEEETVKVAYSYSNIDTIDKDDVAGLTTPARTGVYALLNSKPVKNFKPKIIGAPGFSHEKDVADALRAVGTKLKARVYIDGDTETNDTVSEVIAARANSADAFIIHDKRVTHLWPNLVKDGKEYAMSAAAMGVRSRTDMDPAKGYHHSISSQEIFGFDGLSIPVEYAINDPSVESQLLNAAGVVTVKNVDGLKFCGNENSSFDTNSTGANTDHERFEVTMSTGDVIIESIEYYAETKIDQPMTRAWIDAIVRDVKKFLRTLKGRGAIAGGTCWYEPDENEPTDLAAGEIKFNYEDAPTPPANRITFYRGYNVDLLVKTLSGGAA